MSGFPLLIVFFLAIIFMIVMISKFKVHPFLSILIIAVAFGMVAGIPLVDIKDTTGAVTQQGITSVISAGFSGTFKSIGIVIIFGALIGTVLESTGAAFKLADMTIKLVGKKHPEVAMALMGWIVSIPVFCDSGFVILNPIRRAIVKATNSSSVTLSMALAGGLYIAHVFVPPTPGPIAAAATLGIGDNLLMVMGVGVLASICPLIAAIFFARWAGKHTTSTDESHPEDMEKTYEEIMASFDKLPNGFMTIAPIVVPILLMAAGSIAAMAGLTGGARSVLSFFGTPMIALAVGVIFSYLQLVITGTTQKFNALVEDNLKTVGPILFITAAGGVLGKMIAASALVPFIESQAGVLSIFGIFFPFLLAAILKTAQGSSTVAITTTAGILAPLMGTLGFVTPMAVSIACMAIGAGAMTVSHANDSYFWVVTKFGGLNVEQGYKTQTLLTLVLGLSSMVGIFIMWLIFV